MRDKMAIPSTILLAHTSEMSGDKSEAQAHQCKSASAVDGHQTISNQSSFGRWSAGTMPCVLNAASSRLFSQANALWRQLDRCLPAIGATRMAVALTAHRVSLRRCKRIGPERIHQLIEGHTIRHATRDELRSSVGRDLTLSSVRATNRVF